MRRRPVVRARAALEGAAPSAPARNDAAGARRRGGAALQRNARCILLAAMLVARTAGADGGVVRLSQQAGPYTVTVFTAPTPLRAGPIDASVLVQDGHSGDVVTDAAVRVTLRAGDEPAPTVRGAATRAQATNKLLYAALLDLPAAGRWQVEVTIDHGEAPVSVSFAVDAAPPLPPWRAYWPYFALPAIAMAVYALHQWLVLRRR